MDEFWDTLATLCRPRDARSIVDWSRDIKPPNSARSQSFDPDMTPHLREPLEAHGDASLRELVILMGTGGGKTQILDCSIAYKIVEAPGNILLGIQGNGQAKLHVQARLMPTLKGIPQISHIMAGMNPHRIKADAILFPHMTLHMGGVNMTNGQSRSVDSVHLDEVWEAGPHGIVENFRARLHDRPLGQFVLVSQGGWESKLTDEGPVETELHFAWKRTNQMVYSWRCPECGGVQRYRLRGSDPRGYALRYDRGSEDGEIDEAAIRQSTRLACLDRCGTEFADTPQNRYLLAASGLYVPTNPSAEAIYRGYQCGALAYHWVPWHRIALQHAQAHAALKAGNPMPMEIFRQKRLGENVRLAVNEIDQSGLTVGDYATADYADGRKAEGEAWRFMSIDVQMDHYWVTVRVFRADGSSLRIFADRIGTDEQLRELQLRLGVDSMWVSIDSGHFTDRVYNLAAKWGWRAFKGDHAEQYKFAPPKGRAYHKFYSPMQTVCGSTMRPCKLILFSNINVKRILDRLRNGPRPIPGTEEKTEVPRWEVEGDITETLKRHLYSETERDTISKMGKRSRAYVPIKAKEPNHTWDTEAHHVVFALIAGCLRYHPDDPAPEPNSPPLVN